MSNNPPYATIDLTKEEFDFLLENCDANIAMGLNALQVTESRESAERFVILLEQFKGIRKKLKGVQH